MYFLFNRTTLQFFVTYLTGALNVILQTSTRKSSSFQTAFPFTHAPRLLKLCIPPSNGIVRWWLFPEFGAELPLDNCNSWNVSTQNAFSLPFAAILVNCAPSGEMRNYCTPHITKENFENFLIHRCDYILLSQVYCVWQVVKTPTIIFNNPV